MCIFCFEFLRLDEICQNKRSIDLLIKTNSQAWCYMLYVSI